MAYEVTITDILLAARFLKNRTRQTPLEYSPALSKVAGGKVWLKLENQQIAGSFKPRGAFNRMFAMTQEERDKGVITCSSGNHAQGIAMAARDLKVKAVISITFRFLSITSSKESELNFTASSFFSGSLS